jgi:hypothetical protein
VNHDRISEFDVGLFGVEYVTRAGGAPATPPQQQTFWVASDAGTGQRDVTWSIMESHFAFEERQVRAALS